MAVLQVQLDLGPAYPQQAQPRAPHLAAPLTPQERRSIQRLYVEHRGLIRMFGSKLGRKYRYCLDVEAVYSCIDMAFIKACRVMDPAKGKLSTILGVYAEGEIKHYIRDYNFSVKAPGEVRETGQKARQLLAGGMSLADVAVAVKSTPDGVRDALLATAGVAHDIMGFDLHECPRPTPWDLVDAET